jgi:hypothetical protein
MPLALYAQNIDYVEYFLDNTEWDLICLDSFRHKGTHRRTQDIVSRKKLNEAVLAEKAAELSELKPDASILAVQEEAQAIKETLPLYQQALTKLPELESGIEAHEQEIEALCGSLGENWDAERVSRMDRSMFIRDTVIEYRDRLTREWGLNMIYGMNEEAINSGKTFNAGAVDRITCCRLLKTEALKNTLNGTGPRYRFDHKKDGYKLAILTDAPRLKAWIRLVTMGIDTAFDVVTDSAKSGAKSVRDNVETSISKSSLSLTSLDGSPKRSARPS